MQTGSRHYTKRTSWSDSPARRYLLSKRLLLRGRPRAPRGQGERQGRVGLGRAERHDGANCKGCGNCHHRAAPHDTLLFPHAAQRHTRAVRSSSFQHCLRFGPARLRADLRHAGGGARHRGESGRAHGGAHFFGRTDAHSCAMFDMFGIRARVLASRNTTNDVNFSFFGTPPNPRKPGPCENGSLLEKVTKAKPLGFPKSKPFGLPVAGCTGM